MNARIPAYRRLTEDDLVSVAALEADTFSTPWTKEQYKAVMRHGGCVLFGAWFGPSLAGYIAIAMQCGTGEMEVYNIAVAEGMRRRGIGNTLLRLALKAAARNSACRAILEVRASNAPALALYRSLGFEHVGERKHYYHDTGEDAFVFARSLL